MSENLLIAIVGGMIGGALGVLGGLVSAYYGPRRLEEWREKRHEDRHDGPRKKLLLKMLKDDSWPDGRTLEMLSRVTGTPPEECRRLLIEIDARGIRLKGNVEGWALIEKKPLTEE